MDFAREHIDTTLVQKLISNQFPQWSDLPITAIEPGGWDNKTFRMGDNMLVRLPSAERYAAQVEKEQQWLPVLAQHLPLPIPVPLATGKPSDSYPWNWSVYQWIPGKTANIASISNLVQFARSLADFVKALEHIDTEDAPLAGVHNFYRGGSLQVYDKETRQAIETAGNVFDTNTLIEIWEAALATTWHDVPVWVHGDLSKDNLLTEEGLLSAVIDFGSCGVGDPACDTTMSWTFFSSESREIFCERLNFDKSTWARGRGWALWKALITLTKANSDDSITSKENRRIINELIEDHKNSNV